ncbi:hypothetical protein A3L04_05635 [Thermococcus chitonophagus]|uniref:Uncharacterized protein n=1 Tax=Thermococcus chitonophagus TaxID=54262 RepID=A0A160VRF0_9EURY|nr:hypothetical protein [Thermococcus chitonophagus]ASJ16585.1 hypothetical protein A3L04_05635 [Thermococcus chitonophagus]CUX77495.1 hypothetical protein CHITON_0716 [Thermococcus chitonophagus]
MGLRDWWNDRKERKRIQREMELAVEIFANWLVEHRKVLTREIIRDFVGKPIYFHYPSPKAVVFTPNKKVEMLGEGIYKVSGTLNLKAWLEQPIMFPNFDINKIVVGTDVHFIFDVAAVINVYTGEVRDFERSEYMRYKTYGKSYVRLYDQEGRKVWEKLWKHWYSEGYEAGYRDGESDGYWTARSECPC